MTMIFGVPDHARAEWEELHEVLETTATRSPCTGPDRDHWTGSTTQQAAAAEACLGCPAMIACATYAATADEQLGTWGGRTATERRQRAKKPP